MKIRCQCGAIYNVPESTGGKNVKCKKCANTFVCPTPPPKPNIGAATGAASAAPKQKVPGTFASNPYARSKSAQRTNQQEEEILKKFMSEEKSLEERMRDRREDSIEEDRTSNSMSYISSESFGLPERWSLRWHSWGLLDRVAVMDFDDFE